MEIAHPARDAQISSVSEKTIEVSNEFDENGVYLFSQSQISEGVLRELPFWNPGVYKAHGRYYTPGCRTVYDRLYLYTYIIQPHVVAICSLPFKTLDSNNACTLKKVIGIVNRKIKIIKED